MLKRETLLYFGAILLFAVGSLILIAGSAQALPSGNTCSSVNEGTNPGGFRSFEVAPSTATPGSPLGCDSFTGIGGIHEINSGSSITLKCWERTEGLTPPVQSTSRNLYFQADANNFGSPATSPILTISNPNCDGVTTYTVYCTSNGLAGGSPRFGIVRMAIQAQSALYNVHSEQTQSATTEKYGIFRCNPAVTAASETLNPTPVYVAGDSVTFSFTADSASYNTGTHASGETECGAGSVLLGGSLTLGTTASTFTTTLKGSLTTAYPDDCTLKGRYWLNRVSTLTGYTTQVYAKWDTTSAPSGVTFNGQRAIFTTNKAVDRSLLFVEVDCTTEKIRMMRGETNQFACHWTDARGNNVPNNRLATGYARRMTQPAYDTTDFNSVDFTFGSNQQNAIWTGTAKTTAVDTNGTAALDYVTDLKTFLASRTDTELLGIATYPNRFDVSSTYNATVESSKAATPFVNSTSGFTIGDDTQNTHVTNVRDARGNGVTGVSVTCQRTKATGELETAVSMGTTTAGTTAITQFQTLAPPGPWRYTCTGTLNGNSFSYTVQYLHITTLSSNIDVVILQKVWQASNGTVYLNVTAQGIYWDSMTVNTTPAIPDDNNVTMRVQTQRLGEVRQDLVIWQFPMTYANGPDYLFYANVTVPTVQTWEMGFVAVRMNMSGKPFLDSEQITREVSQTGLQFNADTAARLQSMSDFFNMETTQIMPLLLILIGAMVTFSYTSNRLNSIILAIVHLLMAFAVAGSKASLDEMGPYYAPAAVIILLSFALMTLIKGWTTPPDKDGIKGYPR